MTLILQCAPLGTCEYPVDYRLIHPVWLSGHAT